MKNQTWLYNYIKITIFFWFTDYTECSLQVSKYPSMQLGFIINWHDKHDLITTTG